MNKLKTATVLLLTVLLIAVLAMLPRAVAGVSDFIGNEKPGNAPMQSVALALGTDKTDEPGYMMRKLALEQRMTTIPIEPDQASMTEEEVFTAARDGMTAYMEANIFTWFEYTFSSAEPYLGIDPEDKNNNTIFWGVTFSTKNDPYHHLFLHIDDETGKIIYINYETYGEDRYTYYHPEDHWFMMEGFVDAFFGAINLTQRNEYENLQTESVSELQLTDDVTGVRYSFEDSQYGVIYAEFYITPIGFNVCFPSE